MENRFGVRFGAIFVFIVGCALTVLGLKLALIQQFGAEIPFWDQWNAEGGGVYPALLSGDWTNVEWFSAHNEHRIFLSRLLAVILVLVDGQWNALLQTAVNALIHSACAAYVVYLFAVRDSLAARWRLVIGALAVVGFGSAAGWENTLGGFQSQFYFFVLIGAVILDMASRESLLSRKALLAVLLSAVLLAPFTVASGAFFVFSAACLLVFRSFVSEYRDARGKYLIISFVLFVVAAAAIYATPTVPHHAALKAKSAHEFVSVFLRALSWPLPWFGCLIVWSPTFLAIYLLWKDKTVRHVPAFGLGLAFSLALVLNAAAMAYSRAAGADIGSRYADVLWLGWFVNAYLLLRVVVDCRSPYVCFPACVGASLPIAFFAVALSVLSVKGLDEIDGAAGRIPIHTTHLALAFSVAYCCKSLFCMETRARASEIYLFS